MMPTLNSFKSRLNKCCHGFGSVRGHGHKILKEKVFFFYYFSNFPLFLFVKLPDLRSRSLGPAISHCWSLFFSQIKSLSIDFLSRAIRAKTIRTLLENLFS